MSQAWTAKKFGGNAGGWKPYESSTRSWEANLRLGKNPEHLRYTDIINAWLQASVEENSLFHGWLHDGIGDKGKNKEKIQLAHMQETGYEGRDNAYTGMGQDARAESAPGAGDARPMVPNLLEYFLREARKHWDKENKAAFKQFTYFSITSGETPAEAAQRLISIVSQLPDRQLTPRAVSERLQTAWHAHDQRLWAETKTLLRLSSRWSTINENDWSVPILCEALELAQEQRFHDAQTEVNSRALRLHTAGASAPAGRQDQGGRSGGRVRGAFVAGPGESPGVSTAPDAQCHVHPYATHTNRECMVQNGTGRERGMRAPMRGGRGGGRGGGRFAGRSPAPGRRAYQQDQPVAYAVHGTHGSWGAGGCWHPGPCPPPRCSPPAAASAGGAARSEAGEAFRTEAGGVEVAGEVGRAGAGRRERPYAGHPCTTLYCPDPDTHSTATCRVAAAERKRAVAESQPAAAAASAPPVTPPPVTPSPVVPPPAPTNAPPLSYSRPAVLAAAAPPSFTSSAFFDSRECDDEFFGTAACAAGVGGKVVTFEDWAWEEWPGKSDAKGMQAGGGDLPSLDL